MANYGREGNTTADETAVRMSANSLFEEQEEDSARISFPF